MSKVPGLDFQSPEEVAPLKSTVVLYGPAGSGKSTFASTWPGVYVLAPSISANELKSYQGQGMKDNVLVFDTIDEMHRQASALATAVKRGMLPDCNTLVFDNLTSAQLIAEHELLEAAGKDKLDWEGWNKFAKLWKEMVIFLHKLPINVVWITHAEAKEITPDEVGKMPYTEGGPSLVGKSRRFIPGYADMFFYCDVVDRGAGLPLEFRVYLKQKDVWPARVRGDIGHTVKLPEFLGGLTDDNVAIRPTYDLLAQLMDWQDKAQIEACSAKVKAKKPAQPVVKVETKRKVVPLRRKT